MSDTWVKVAASEVRPGQRVRLGNGTELTATRIEPRFFGMDNMVAFVEDTDVRWYKQPTTVDAEVEVLRS